MLNKYNSHWGDTKIMRRPFCGKHAIHIKHESCPGQQLMRVCGCVCVCVCAWDKYEEYREAIRSTTQLGKMRNEKENRVERESQKKSTAGHHSQRHKSRHSQLDSNANLAPSTQWKGQPQFSQVPMCVCYPQLTGTPHSPHCLWMCVCARARSGVCINMHIPLVRSKTTMTVFNFEIPL